MIDQKPWGGHVVILSSVKGVLGGSGSDVQRPDDVPGRGVDKTQRSDDVRGRCGRVSKRNQHPRVGCISNGGAESPKVGQTRWSDDIQRAKSSILHGPVRLLISCC